MERLNAQRGVVSPASQFAKNVIQAQKEDEVMVTKEALGTPDDRGTKQEAWRGIISYGGGLKRQNIRFVPATNTDFTPVSSVQSKGDSKTTGDDISAFYLNLVLRNAEESRPAPPHASDHSAAPLLTPSSLSPPAGDHDQAATTTSNSKCTKSTKGRNCSLQTASEGVPGQPQDKFDVKRSQNSTPDGSRRDIDAHNSGKPTPVNNAETEGNTSNNISSPFACSTYFCKICQITIPLEEVEAHESTIAHQASEPHSDLPHHLDRKSEGFKHMVRLKWDPDERKGLGPLGHGIRFPIKTKMKDDNLGIGAKPEEKEPYTEGSLSSRDQRRQKKIAHRALTAKEMREVNKKDREKRQQLHEMLHRR